MINQSWDNVTKSLDKNPILNANVKNARKILGVPDSYKSDNPLGYHACYSIADYMIETYFNTDKPSELVPGNELYDYMKYCYYLGNIINFD